MSFKILFQALLVFLAIIILSYFFFYNLHDANQITKGSSFKKNDFTETKNLIEGIKYSFKDNSNNTYNLVAKYGKRQNIESEIITLYKVYTIIEFENKTKLEIWSDEAIYNISNNYTKFQYNVLLKDEKNKIECDNLELDAIKGFANLKGKVLVNNNNTSISLDVINIDLKQKTARLEMFASEKKIKMIINNELN